MAQKELMRKEREIFLAFAIAQDAKMALKANMEASKKNKKKLKAIMVRLGLDIKDQVWAVGG